MAITAETRNSIIELVVTAYNAPPGTTLLTELVAIVEDGGTLADVATALTTSDTWNGLYPSFQTAEEFAAEWLGNLVPEASADALAGGIEIAVGLINGGASFADIIVVAQDFLANLAEDDAEFGSSAANFNNKVEVATYHTVTLELDAETVSELQEVLVDVTSDDDSVTDANDAAAASVPGEVVSLTTGLDTGAAFSTGSTNDVFSAVDTGAATTTLTTGDSLDGGDGTDTLSLAVSGSATASAGIASTDVEQVKIYNNSDSAYTLNASLMSGLTDVFVTAGTSATTASVAGAVNLHLISTDQDATISASGLTGSADAAIILANGADDITATYNSLETVNLMAVGAASELTVVSDALETVNVSGDADIEVTVDFAGVDNSTMTSTFDASAATGDVDATITAGSSDMVHVAMGGGDDTIELDVAITEDVTIMGGEGTDTLSLSGTGLSFDAESEDAADGANVSGIEALYLAAVTVDGRALSGNAESSITKATFAGGGAVTHLPVSSIVDYAGGTIRLGDAEGEAGAGGEVTALTLTQYGVFSGTATTLIADEVESLTVLSSGASSAYSNSVTMSAEGSASLTSVVAAGSNQLALTIGGDALESVNAAGITGSETFTLTTTGEGDVAVTASSVAPVVDAEAETANAITTGSGADTITGGMYGDNISTGEGADVVDAGDGNNTVTTADGNDDVTAGAGDDNIDTGDGDDTVDGGAGDDTISGGKGDDVLSGGDGDDVLIAGRGDDTIDGGGEDDLIVVSSLSSEDVIDGGEGTDSLIGDNTALTTDNYQPNAAFASSDGSGEDAPSLPGIEAMWLNFAPDEEHSVDLTGADSLKALYLDVSADIEDGETTAITLPEGLTAVNLRMVEDDSEMNLEIIGSGEDLTLNIISSAESVSEIEADISVSNVDAFTLVLPIVDGESELGAFDENSIADLNVSDASSITIALPDSGLAYASEAEQEEGNNGITMVEDGVDVEVENVTYDGDALESVTISAGDATDLYIASLDLDSEGEIDDGLTISIHVGENAELYLGAIDAAEAEGVSVTVEVEAGGSLSTEGFGQWRLGDGSSTTITAGSLSSIELAHITGDVSIDSADVSIGGTDIAGAVIDLDYVGGEDASAENSASLTLTGRGTLNDPANNAEDVPLLLRGESDITIDLSGWEDEAAERTDTLYVDVGETNGDVTVDLGSGESFDQAHFAEDSIGAAETQSFTLIGEVAGEFEFGTAAGDVGITAGDGEHNVDTNDGDDTVSLGDGNSDIVTGAGDDEITVGDGDNTISASEGDNTITAGDGENDITTGEGDDEITVGDGNNSITTGAGDATITAGVGEDTIDVGAGVDVISAGTGNDLITLADATMGSFVAAEIDEIIGLDVEGANGDQDTISIGGEADSLAIVSDLNAGEDVQVGAADAEGLLAASDVLAIVNNGVMTLSGEEADVEAFDTLEEYVDAALIALAVEDAEGAAASSDERAIAFAFDGATYIVTAYDDASVDDDTTLNDIIKLTGVTGADLVQAGGSDGEILIG